jgi:coenzyme F420-reducing hydrogenase beta subunit
MRPFPDHRPQEGDRLVSPSEIVRSGLCIGCGSCAAGRTGAAMRWDRHGFLKPDGPEEWIEAPSDSFSRQCPFSPAAASEDQIAAERFPATAAADPRIGRFEAAYVGHAAQDPFRPNGSSGGLTSWVAAELLRTGVIDAVAHVVPTDPATGRLFA